MSKPDNEPCGIDLVFNDDGTVTKTYFGGFQPGRDLTPAELRPWILLAEARVNKQAEAAAEDSAAIDDAG